MKRSDVENGHEPLPAQKITELFFGIPEQYRADARWWVTEEGERQLEELASRDSGL